MNYDKIIVNLFLNKETGRSKYILKKIDSYPNIKNYILNRYNNAESAKEILDRMRFHIEIIPGCKVCGRHTKYKGIKEGYPYWLPYCSCKCAQISQSTRDKYVDTCLSRYGVNNTMKTEKVKENMRKALLSKYGVTSVAKLESVQEKIKETNIEKYGYASHLSNKKIRNKIKETCKKKYGVDSPLASKEILNKIYENNEKLYGVKYNPQIGYVKEKIKISTNKLQSKNKRKETCKRKYGVESISMLEEVKQKKLNTMLHNNTINYSAPEEELYLYIKEKFPDVKRQYRDKNRYPFNCDFYIPSLDLFIELNAHWTHAKHEFNTNIKEDLDKLNKWKSKKTKYFENAIKTWTVRDPLKRKTAKENNLNFKEVWSLEEGKSYIDSL